MPNLTLVIDEDLLRAARIKALQQGTSVNEICRNAIARFAAPLPADDDFMAQLEALARKMRLAAPARGGEALWPGREVLYDEAMADRLPDRADEKTPATAAT